MINIDSLVREITARLEADPRDGLLRHARATLLELAEEARQAKEERNLAEQLLTENANRVF